jgi:hypothetical protein
MARLSNGLKIQINKSIEALVPNAVDYISKIWGLRNVFLLLKIPKFQLQNHIPSPPKIYQIKFANKFGLDPGREFESAEGNSRLMQHRGDILNVVLKLEKPGAKGKPKIKLVEMISTFQPFNIKELEVDYYDSGTQRGKFVLFVMCS